MSISSVAMGRRAWVLHVYLASITQSRKPDTLNVYLSLVSVPATFAWASHTTIGCWSDIYLYLEYQSKVSLHKLKIPPTSQFFQQGPQTLTQEFRGPTPFWSQATELLVYS